MSSARPGREIDTRDGLRALGISLVVANHAFAAPVHGGLNLLFLVSGIAFAQLCFGGRDRSVLALQVMRFARPLAVWSVVLCLFWFAVFGRFDPAELFMGQQLVHDGARLENSPIWYTQVMLQMLLGIVAILALPGMLQQLRRAPVAGAAGWLAGAVALCGGGTDRGRHRSPCRQAFRICTLGTSCWAGCSGPFSMRARPSAWTVRS